MNRRFATATLAVGLLFGAGCVPHTREVADHPADDLRVVSVDAPEPTEPTEPAEPSVAPAPAAPPVQASTVTEPVDMELIEYGPFPGEEVTQSPLDELAELSPTFEESRSPDVPPVMTEEPVEPTYDIPIEINDKVRFWLDYYGNRRHDSFQVSLERSGQYMHVFRRVFAEEGVPLDLIYMAHVESAFKTTAYSRARARGIFQFISATGRRYGLRIDYWVDDRLDPEKSARASARYLRDLYEEFGDWYLALAGYNAGEGKVRRALRRSGQTDFWGIARTNYLRRETKNYVPAILASILIARQPEAYGFELEYEAPIEFESIEIPGAADLQVLARCAGTDLDTMKHLNPALRRYQTPPDAAWNVHVPPGAGERTSAELRTVPEDERVLYARHTVRPGDTLYDLARDYGVSVSAIQQTNHMGQRTMIREGKELVIPTVAAGSYPSVPTTAGVMTGVPGEPTSYRVRRGDTLSAIADRHRTTAAAIASASGIAVSTTLHPGDRLTVVPGVRSATRSQSIARGDSRAVDGGLLHVVRRGESLSVIARRYATTPQAIAQANRMPVNQLLQIGDRLKVKPGSGYTRTVALLHTVRQGDSLWRIAEEYNTTVDRLCSLNRISEHSTLHPGTQLAIASD